MIATAPIGCAALVSALAIVMRSGVTPKLCAANAWPVRPKPRDHLVEHEQDPVRVADFPQPLAGSPWAERRHAGGARDRLDEARGDVLRAVQIDEALQVVRQLGAVRALARDESGFPADACGACGRCRAALDRSCGGC